MDAQRFVIVVQDEIVVDFLLDYFAGVDEADDLVPLGAAVYLLHYCVAGRTGQVVVDRMPGEVFDLSQVTF